MKFMNAKKNISYCILIVFALSFFSPIYSINSPLEKSLVILQERLDNLQDVLIQKPIITIIPFDSTNREQQECVKNICKKDYTVLVSEADLNKKLTIEEYTDICKNYFLRSKFKYIVTVNDSPAGFISYQDDCHIILLGVKPEYRGQGLSNVLMEHAINALTKKGCQKISLYVEKNNTAAITVYEKFGFVNAGWFDPETIIMNRHVQK